MGFADDLAAMGDDLSKATETAKNAHAKALAAKASASERIATDLAEVGQFLRQRGHSPLPIVERPLPQSRWSMSRTQLRLVGRGWALPGTGMLTTDSELFWPGHFKPRARLSKPVLKTLYASPPPGVAVDDFVYLHGHLCPMPALEPLPYDTASLVAISDFGPGNLGQRNYRQFRSTHMVTLPKPPPGVPANLTSKYLGVTHDEEPILVSVNYDPQDGAFCTLVSFEYQLKYTVKTMLA
ncbi:hypothetical protein [Mycolicibacterium lacusdiani]|jgi:hypothetical protein|uniref:hypothetical protein n=1 Tax=Mycolicibacterium lacusdiani TaxID=2895283 RepID=UPI001F2C90EE|nr:hypothetical protein [Mycolicibacterium lacusdiani]